MLTVLLTEKKLSVYNEQIQFEAVDRNSNKKREYNVRLNVRLL